MFKINRVKALKIILLGALVNLFLYLGVSSTGVIRLISMLFLNISGVLLVVFFFKLTKKKFDTNLYFKIMFFLLITWCFTTVIRAMSPNGQTFITLFGHYLIGWAWLTPLAVVFGFNISNWLESFDFLAKVSLFASILALGSPIYTVHLVFAVMELTVFTPMLFLTYFYHPIKRQRIIIFLFFAYIIVSIFSGQRANLGLILMMLSFVIFELYRQKEVGMYKKISVVFSVLIVIMLIVSQVDNIIESIENDDDAQTDTRTFLFVELFGDLEPYELIIGRGALGTYFSPYFEYTEKHGLAGDSPTRMVNEVGYLQMILKGGGIMMGLHLLILLPAALLGIFGSKNIITRMCGYYIFILLMMWMINSYAIYSAKFIMLWMAAGTVISSKNRKLTNKDILVKINKRYEFAEK
jgi:hypothetical protein